MNPSSPAKFGAAFAAGLVVALAGAMIYVKSSGLHEQGGASAPIVEQMKQPESLNAGKAEEPTVAMPAPKPVAPPVVARPEPVTSSPTPLSFSPKARGVAFHRVSSPPVRRNRYPPHSLPESQSTIRVEVSQIRSAPEANRPLSEPPVAAMPSGPIRTVNEDHAARYRPPPVAPPAPTPHTVTLQAGTSLVVRLGERLSTDHNYDGDTFRATLERPIVSDGFVIADKGSKVLGKIVGIEKAGKFEGTSNLQLALTEINTTDGQRILIQTSFVNKKGPASDGSEIAKLGGGAVLGAIIGAVAGGGKGAAIGAGAGGAAGAGAVMLGKGRPAVLESETPLTFQLAGATTITERLN